MCDHTQVWELLLERPMVTLRDEPRMEEAQRCVTGLANMKAYYSAMFAKRPEPSSP